MAASYDLAGSTALVTGAAGDIGRTVAVRLAGSGAAVVLTDLDRAAGVGRRSVAVAASAHPAEPEAGHDHEWDHDGEEHRSELGVHACSVRSSRIFRSVASCSIVAA